MPGSLTARGPAHDAGHDMVTGTMLNGTFTPAGWASYFLDNAHCLPGRASRLRVAGVRCSIYARPCCAGGFPGGHAA